MSWIEGIGDEVTITVGIGLILLLLIAAWLSTGTRDIPFISVIVVQLRRRRVLREQAAASEAEATTGEPTESVQSGSESSSVENVPVVTQPPEVSLDRNPIADRTTVTDNLSNNANETNSPTDSIDASESTNSENVNSENTEESSEQAICTCGDLPVPNNENELRQRRINFLSSKSQQPEPVRSLPTSCQKCCVPDPDSSETSEPTPAPVPSDINREGTEVEESRNNEDNWTSGTSDSNTDSEIRVRIKFLNDTQRLVMAPATETIGNFRRRHFSDELSESKLVRFIFNGQVLQNDASTLQSYNIGDNSVLHCLVTQQQQQQQQQQHAHDDYGFNIGLLMFPLFGLLLAVIWYLRFTYRQFFNVTSTLTLAGITFLYLAAFLSSLRTPVNHEHID